LPKIDLLIGGSPCQGFSIAGKRLNFDDPRSRLFFEFVNCLKYFKPKYFLLENVRMKKEIQDVISAELGCEPVLINSALVSAQQRKRLYWCNWAVGQPMDREIFLKDILEDGDGIIHTNFSGNKARHYKKSCALRAGASANYQVVFKDKNKPIQVGIASDIKGNDILKRIYSTEAKSPTLTAICGGNQERKIAIDESHYRKLTPMECERLQTLPDGYTDSVSNSQRYKMIGNGWNIETIVHILRQLT
jgi:DNA-cytosine methyltransferase